MGPLRSLLAALAVAALLLAPGCRLQPAGSTKDVTDRAPAFSLPDHNAEPVNLATLREKGPAVLVFYRGHW